MGASFNEPIEGVYSSLEIVRGKLVDWWEAAIALLPNLVVAILVIVAFGLVSRLVRKLVRRFLLKMTSSKSIARLLSTLAGIAVVIIGLFIALGVLQLEKTVTSLLAGAGVVGIALAFAFQDLAANLIAGVYLSFQRPFVIGDLIETQDTFGIVDAVDLRNTRIRTMDGQIVLTPNKEVFENKLINFSKTGIRRVTLSVGVSYAEDLEAVREIATEAISALELRRTEEDVEFFYESFGASSIDFVVRFWIDHQRQSQYRAAVSEAIIAIKKAFDAEDIMIPFPIRTLDFGIKGGESLAQALPVPDQGQITMDMAPGSREMGSRSAVGASDSVF